MKKNLFYTIFFAAFAISALPMSANDYLKIYFKDGHTERHYMHLVESISTTKYDLEGNLHSDYQMQQIVMPDTTYSYYLADIDSMAFRKVDEEQVKERVESVQSSLEQISQQSSNIEDLASHVDEIKSIDGVEEVYYDGNDLFIQIRDWYVVSILRQPIPENIVSSANPLDRKNIKHLIPTTNDGSPMKVTIGFQMKDDYNFTDGKVAINLLNTKFSIMGYNPNYELGDELDFDFFHKRIFDSNVLLIDTHGGCGIFNKKHYLFTGIESSSNDLVGLSVDQWFDISENIDIDDIGVSLCNYAGGNLFNNPFGLRWFFTVTEDYIRKSPYRFTGTGPHIVFVAACSSLQGNDILTRSDGKQYYGSDSFAQVFFEKGADVYLGYNNGTYRSSYAADSFLDYMLHGASVEQAFNTLHPLYKYEEDKDEKAALIDLYNQKSNNPKGIFIVNTHTETKTNQDLNEEYANKQQVELGGTSFCWDLNENHPNFGFRIATEPNINENTNGIDILSNDFHHTGENYKEVAFSGVFKPEPGITYYYRATTYDGIHYNWGEERSFTIDKPAEIPAEPKDLGLPSGTLWASYNVGATSPEDYGEYFAWGEIKKKDVYNESTYQYCKNGAYINIGDDIGGTEYDVAHVRWGDKWMIPNKRMMQELYEYCSTEWTTQNGVYGTKFTGPNGETIFLPAAGYYKEDQQIYPGVWGDYWSSTASEAITYGAYELYFKNDLIKCDYVYNDNPTYRRNGHTVRPVIPGLELSSNGLISIMEGKSETVSVRYGSGSYSYEVDNEGIVAVSIIGPTITINAQKVGEVIVTVIDKNGGKAYLSVAVKAIPEAKDLGLPSGTQWASFNIGANTPEDYGEYYAWGEMEVKDTYTESNYKHCKNGVYANIGEDIRGTEYDAAQAKWGGEWMMPSMTQYNELINNCTSEWTTINGVNGRKFTSKINGEYVFFPAAGYYGNSVNKTGTNGYYWTGNRDPKNIDKATNLAVRNATPGFAQNYREFGFSVRPVISGLELSITGTLSVFEGKSKTVTIKSGSGSYQYDVDKDGIVSASISGSTITINAIQIGDVVFTVTDTKGGQKVSFIVTVSAVPTAVDLGLPSGTKWANINVGANNPEESGDYYAWGETEVKTEYKQSTYTYYKNSSYVDIGNDVRGTEYDVAHVKWGGSWMMPSSTQINELLNNCTREWTTVNDVSGCKFTSKINGESIFLPAVGFYESAVTSSGSSGYYWACDKVRNKNNGYSLYIKSETQNMDYYSRYYGFAVRPVIREQSEEDDPRMDDVVPKIMRDKLRDHMPIYSGVNPPNIEGSYFISPYTTVFCEDGNWEPGHVIDNYKILFSNQSSDDNTIDMIEYAENGGYNKGTDAFISGDGTNFSAYFITEGMSQNIRTKKALVISGTKTENGIENYCYGFVLLEKGSDPNKKLMDVGVYRVFKDGDGISEPTTWEFESNANQIKSKNMDEIQTTVDGLGLKEKNLHDGPLQEKRPISGSGQTNTPGYF